jgi:hypothetical protein
MIMKTTNLKSSNPVLGQDKLSKLHNIFEELLPHLWQTARCGLGI